MQILYF